MREDSRAPDWENPVARRPHRGWAHVAVAFLSALLVPALLAYGTLVAWSSSFHVVARPEAIATIVIGAFVSAAAVYRLERIPLWAAAVIGTVVVLFLAVASSI